MTVVMLTFLSHNGSGSGLAIGNYPHHFGAEKKYCVKILSESDSEIIQGNVISWNLRELF